MKLQNKVLGILMSLVFVLFSVTACGGKKSADLPENLDLTTLANKLEEGIEFEDKDLEILAEQLNSRYVNQVNFEDVKKAVVVAGGGFIAEEILLFETKNKEAAARVKAGIEKRFEYFRTSFGNYTPEQLANLENPVLIDNGNYIFSVISKNNAKANEIIHNWIKEHKNN